MHPYQDGYEDQVMKVDWGMHSIYVPYDGAYHAHFNTSANEARVMAIYSGTNATVMPGAGESGVITAMVPTREGGTLIEYEDEDPEIRKRFEATLKENGVESSMPPVAPR